MAKLPKEDKIVREELDDFYNKAPLTIHNAKIDIKCKNEKQKSFLKLIKDKEITLCSGPAGSGKTFLACLEALKLLKAHPHMYKKIVLVKSVTTLEDEEIGFLKGTMEDKMLPFIYSFINNFEKIIPKSLVTSMRTTGVIEIMPIAYMRGINLDNSIVILDEAQNCTKDHLKTILTRIGYDSKYIILSDTEQIDRKKKDTSGIQDIMNILSGLDEIGVMEFTTEDIVRNPLIQKILDKWK